MRRDIGDLLSFQVRGQSRRPWAGDALSKTSGRRKARIPCKISSLPPMVQTRGLPLLGTLSKQPHAKVGQTF